MGASAAVSVFLQLNHNFCFRNIVKVDFLELNGAGRTSECECGELSSTRSCPTPASQLLSPSYKLIFLIVPPFFGGGEAGSFLCLLGI